MGEKGIYQERIEKAVDSLKRTDMDALLLNRTCNIAYLTGAVNSCSWVFISKKGERVALVLDADEDVYKEESILTDVRSFRDHDPLHLFRKVMKEMGLTHSKLGLELGRPGLPHHTLDMLRIAFPPSVQFVNGEKILEEIRVSKSDEEVEAIKKAVEITELGMETAVKTIKPGISESDVELEAEYAMRKAGGRIPVINSVSSGNDLSWPIIRLRPKESKKGMWLPWIFMEDLRVIARTWHGPSYAGRSGKDKRSLWMSHPGRGGCDPFVQEG